MITLYVLTDPIVIDYILNNDIEGFTEFLTEASFESSDLKGPYTFETEAEAVAFGDGLELSHGEDGEALVLNEANRRDKLIIKLLQSM